MKCHGKVCICLRDHKYIMCVYVYRLSGPWCGRCCCNGFLKTRVRWAPLSTPFQQTTCFFLCIPCIVGKRCSSYPRRFVARKYWWMVHNILSHPSFSFRITGDFEDCKLFDDIYDSHVLAHKSMGLMQGRRNSIANALELRLSGINASKCWLDD